MEKENSKERTIHLLCVHVIATEQGRVMQFHCGKKGGKATQNGDIQFGLRFNLRNDGRSLRISSTVQKLLKKFQCGYFIA